jgi:hypothetical protein
MSLGNKEFSRHGNNFEGSWIIRADYVRSASLHTHPTYTDHPIIRQIQEANLLAATELGGRTSYIYRWATGSDHVSAHQTGDHEAQCNSLELSRSRNVDVRLDGLLVPADLTPRWRDYLAGTRTLVTPEEWELNRRALGL